VASVQTDDSKEMIDLLAKVLVSGTTYLFKKGLDRDYIEKEEDTRSLRGKIMLSSSLQRQLFKQAKACCAFDELSYHVLHNQLLKTTIHKVIQIKDLDKDIGKDLIAIYRRFPDIEEIDIQRRLFRKVRLNRNNLYYGFLLNICEIIHENLLINEDTGEYLFRDFVRDDRKMAYLFEAFVLNFYKRELTDYTVKREDIKWAVVGERKDHSFLPLMKTDTSLIAKDKNRKIVIETKFYKEAMQTHYNTEKVISSNMYQLYAYLKNLEDQGDVNCDIEGVLLYPTVSQEVNLRFSFPMHDIRVLTLNLNQDWQNIHNDLLALVAC